MLGFVLFHGVSIVVAIRLRKERDRARIAELLQFSGSAVVGMYVSLGALIVFGVVAGFAGKWWGYGGSGFRSRSWSSRSRRCRRWPVPVYEQLKDAIQLRPSGVPRKSDEELDQLLRSRLALFNAVWGMVALVLITFLMIWKPDWRV